MTKTKSHWLQRGMALLLAVLMCVSLLSAAVFAEDAQTPQQQLEALVMRRSQLVLMRVAEGNRLDQAHPLSAKSIRAVIKMLDKQIGALDIDIGGRLKKHFAHKLDLLKGLKGVGPHTQAMLMGALPELGELNRREISKLVG